MPGSTSTAGDDPQSTRLSPLPIDDAGAAAFPLTPQVTSESEGDLESESDLPVMDTSEKTQLPLHPRNASDLKKPDGNTSGHLNTLAMPQMQRAYSSPGVDSTGRYITPGHPYPRRPSSPLSSGRRRSPLRAAFEEVYPGSSWSNLHIEPNIPEHAELEISSPVTPENELGHVSAMPTYSNISNTFPRSRRRPTSPLHQSASAPSLHASARSASPHLSGSASPSFTAISSVKYANEPYPSYGYSLSSASSMPSTPTSLRSRSPSISSLDTIEDTPDAEEAARLEEELGKARSGDDTDAGGETRRRSLDLRGSGLRSNKDRKRWSVCGAERRADFSLEPIEE